jgi:hypothetical protein
LDKARYAVAIVKFDRADALAAHFALGRRGGDAATDTDMKLTQKTVATLALPDGKSEAIFYDEDFPGFGLRLRGGGSRTWVFTYKIGSQHRRITLGSLAALTPARARETAADLHAAVRLGRDPSGEKSEGRVRAAETMFAVTQSSLTYQSGHLRRARLRAAANAPL